MRLSAPLGLVLVGLLGVAACTRPESVLTPPPEPVPPSATDEPGKPRVKLAVLLVFDQLRGDFLEKWRPILGKDGFARIQNDGITFTNCHYPYGTTTTGPGHASMLTGTCPDRHGVINNGWYENGVSIYCAGSTRYQFVPGPTPKNGTVGNPDRLLAETVADVLKATHPSAKVFGLSLKDRSAILPCGKRPDGVYWFTGTFVTSTYYDDKVHPWVEAFNASGAADKWFGRDWTRFRPDLDYEKWSGPDDAPGEGKGVQVTAKDDPARGWCQGVAFPHPNTGGKDKPNKQYYESLANSPFGNDLLLELAKTCVTAEQLGADDAPDLLVISFSSNDLVGHTWGPDSQEVLDITLRSDALMADLLAFLDEKVGPGNYLVGITADHGICPLPEASRGRGLDAKRADPRDLQKAVEDHLTKAFGAADPAAAKPKDPPGPKKATVAEADEDDATGKGPKKPAWVDVISFPWVYLNPKVAAAAGKSRDEVAKAAAEALRGHPDVARVFTRADLAGDVPAADVIANRCKRSFHPERSGDVYVVLKEWYLPSRALETGTTHGAPWDYDTHSPLLFFGPGISGGKSDEPTTPQATAAVFARWLGLRNPKHAEFPVPKALDGK
jgi:predicted AlkP superfamily pyrophosphatase or phosphodiesterase